MHPSERGELMTRAMARKVGAMLWAVSLVLPLVVIQPAQAAIFILSDAPPIQLEPAALPEWRNPNPYSGGGRRELFGVWAARDESLCAELKTVLEREAVSWSVFDSSPFTEWTDFRVRDRGTIRTVDIEFARADPGNEGTAKTFIRSNRRLIEVLSTNVTDPGKIWNNWDELLKAMKGSSSFAPAMLVMGARWPKAVADVNTEMLPYLAHSLSVNVWSYLTFVTLSNRQYLIRWDVEHEHIVSLFEIRGDLVVAQCIMLPRKS